MSVDFLPVPVFAVRESESASAERHLVQICSDSKNK